MIHPTNICGGVMKNKIILILTVLLTISCSSENVQTGGTDIGGSNSILGKPIESYAVNVSQLPEYKDYLHYIFAELDIVLPSLSRTLRNALAVSRTWYIVPIELQKLPNSKIGIPSSTATTQYALHTKKSVWISGIERNKIVDPLDAATHILHEVVMSLRVDQNSESKTILTTQDYEDIRALTSYLMKRDFESVELQNFLNKHHFFYKKGSGSLFPLPSEEVFLRTPIQIYNLLKSQSEKDLPNLAKDPLMQGFLGYCTFKFNSEEGKIKIEVSDKSYNKILRRTEFTLDEIVGRQNINGGLQLSLVEKTPNTQRPRVISFYFLENVLRSLTIIEKSKEKFESNTKYFSCTKGLK